MQVPEDGAERGEQPQQEDDDQADLLARVDLELKEHGDRDDGDHNVRHDGHNRVRREGRPGRETRPGHQRVPRLVHLQFAVTHNVSTRPGSCTSKRSVESRAPTYGLAGEDQGKGAPQMPSDDADHGDPDDAAVDDVRGALEQPQVADEQGDLEEADAQLVDGSAGIVGARVRDQVRLGAQGER